jgi:FkbM family methyltransferase
MSSMTSASVTETRERVHDGQAERLDATCGGPDGGLIFDIGMDLCQDTDFYLAKGFRVVSVDANPSVCEAAAERYAAQVASGQLTIVNRAISENREPLIFYVCKTLSAWSTASPRLRDEKAKQGAAFEEIEVKGARAADLLEEYGVPYFAKIDIEGFDLICLQGFRGAPAKPKYISTEVDFYTVDEQIACLEDLGYRRFALVNQAMAPHQTPPRPAREGRDIDYTFAHHASGLFGRELAAEWVDAAGVRRQCQAVINQYRASGLLDRLAFVKPLQPWLQQARDRYLPLAHDWYDIHATTD